MQQPSRFVDPSRLHYVCKLNMTIYGLKEAPLAWFSTFNSWLISYNFHTSKVYLTLFIMHNSTICMFMLIYVDDMILTASSSLAIENLIASLGFAFPLKDLGQLSYFLGVEL